MFVLLVHEELVASQTYNGESKVEDLRLAFQGEDAAPSHGRDVELFAGDDSRRGSGTAGGGIVLCPDADRRDLTLPA
jgi:hypothetical protein